MEVLLAHSLSKSYGSLEVLKGVNLSVNEGEVVAIIGASGAGKSTLLHILGTLDVPDQGNVFIRGENVLDSYKAGSLAQFRNKNIGFVFQFHNLLPEFSAVENVMMPGLIGGIPKSDVKDKALHLMNRLALQHCLDHRPSQMSGGERQRAAVARALINAPALVFADEPSGNLDSQNAHELHRLFFDLRDEFKHTFIIVTHNQGLADMADKKLEMKDGIIVKEG